MGVNGIKTLYLGVLVLHGCQESSMNHNFSTKWCVLNFENITMGCPNLVQRASYWVWMCTMLGASRGYILSQGPHEERTLLNDVMTWEVYHTRSLHWPPFKCGMPNSPLSIQWEFNHLWTHFENLELKSKLQVACSRHEGFHSRHHLGG